jgi:hypothetical protein
MTKTLFEAVYLVRTNEAEDYRGLAQYGGPPGWLEEIDPAGFDFVRDGRSMPHALTDPVWG